MFHINDRVYHVFNMGKVGTVTEIALVETGMHLMGGTAQQRMVLVVTLPDGKVINVPADEAMKAE